METFFIVTTASVLVVFIAYKIGGVLQRRKDRSVYVPPVRDRGAARKEARDYYERDMDSR